MMKLTRRRASRGSDTDTGDSPQDPHSVRLWTASPRVSGRRRILVLKLDHLGDFIIAIPAMRDLRNHFPTDEITLVCGSWNKILAESLGLFDEILVYDFFPSNTPRWNGIPRRPPSELRAITRGTYDIALDLRVDADTRFLLSCVAATVKCGIGAEYEFSYLDIALPVVIRHNQLWRGERAFSTFRAADFKSNELTPSALFWETDFSRTDRCIIFGPYTTLPAGKYRATFHFGSSGLWLAGFSCKIDVEVAQRAARIAVLRLGRGHLRAGHATVEFSNTVEEPLEFRVHTRGRPRGGGAFRFFGVTVEHARPDTGAPAKLALRQLHRAECASLLVALLAERLQSWRFPAGSGDPEITGTVLPDEALPVLEGPGAICIAPVGNSPIRDWPAANYAALIRMILDRLDRRIILLGTEDQRSALDEIVRSNSGDPRLLNLAGRTEWTELPTLFRSSAMVIANNSGIAHFAAACGARVLAIYSGTHTPEEWGPRGNGRVFALTADVPCSPCGYEDIKCCSYQHRCMTSISPETVFEKVALLLEPTGAQP